MWRKQRKYTRRTQRKCKQLMKNTPIFSLLSFSIPAVPATSCQAIVLRSNFQKGKALKSMTDQFRWCTGYIWPQEQEGECIQTTWKTAFYSLLLNNQKEYWSAASPGKLGKLVIIRSYGYKTKDFFRLALVQVIFMINKHFILCSKPAFWSHFLK